MRSHVATIFVRILKRDTQWLLDFGYKIVIPWLLRGVSEQNTLTLGLRPRDTGVLFRYTPSTHGITITYIRTASARICTPLIVSRSLRSLTNYKYSTLPRGVLINIATKVGIFPEAEGRGKYSLPWVQYYRYSTRKG